MSKTKIKVGFAGTPKIAFDIFNEILLSDEISTEFVLTQPDKLSGRGLTASKSLFKNSAKLPVLQPDDLNSKDLVDKIKDFGVDILVVVAYGKLLVDYASSLKRSRIKEKLMKSKDVKNKN